MIETKITCDYCDKSVNFYGDLEYPSPVDCLEGNGWEFGVHDEDEDDFIDLCKKCSKDFRTHQE